MNIGNRNRRAVCSMLLILVLLVMSCASPCMASAADATESADVDGNAIRIIYGIVSAMSFLIFLGYCFLVKKRTPWFLMLFIAILIANCGYFVMSLADDLGSALMANRIGYIGSGLLPLAMEMIILDACRIRYKKFVPVLLSIVSAAAILLAVSGGYLNLYYSDVWVEEIDGLICLQKEYGPLHILYTIYLLAYFALMVATIVDARVRKIQMSGKYTLVLLAAVLGNMIVWMAEQFVYTKFEFLSLSYIVTGVFLLLIHTIQLDYNALVMATKTMNETPRDEQVHLLPPEVEALFDEFSHRAVHLTAAERNILRYYADGKDVNEVAELAFISIHTVRRHNANMYQKLGVGSRDELMLYLDLFRRSGRLDELLRNQMPVVETQNSEEKIED